jgi:hypothetical protein
MAPVSLNAYVPGNGLPVAGFVFVEFGPPDVHRGKIEPAAKMLIGGIECPSAYDPQTTEASLPP